MNNEPRVSITSELHESLCEGLGNYLDQNAGWDVDRVMNAALALFLLQGGDDRSKVQAQVKKVFLAARFGDVADAV